MSAATWVTRVNAGLKRRDGAEREIADALAEHKQKVGRKQWLADCEREWGWSESTAYRHLDPKQMAAARAHTCAAAAAASPKIGRPEPEAPVEPDQKEITRRRHEQHVKNLAADEERAKSGREPLLQETKKKYPGPYTYSFHQPPAPLTGEALADYTEARAKESGRSRITGAARMLDRHVAEIEADQKYLHTAEIEILSGIWDRLGVLIEQWGIESSESERDAMLESCSGRQSL